MLMLLFYVGSECYALDAGPIVEIIPKVEMKKIPQAAEYIVGHINYGGTSIPVIDVPQIIEKRPATKALHTRIIVVEHEKQLLGLLGEKVVTTLDLDPTQFRPSGVQMKDLPFLGGIYNEAGRSIQLIQLDMLFHYLTGTLF